ncbi:MAG: RNA 2',3'-cyclic phosphodiesterase [Terracidiphilus sp.]
MRLFVALPLPAETRAALVAWAGQCGAQPGLRWTPEDQLHITLQFLGEVGVDRVGSVGEALDGIRSPSFSVSLARVEVLGRAGVLAAAAEPIPALLSLADAVQSHLASFAANSEERAFRPHATLARARRGAQVPKPRSLPALQELRFRASCFRLYRSELRPEGAVHTVIREWELQRD